MNHPTASPRDARDRAPTLRDYLGALRRRRGLAVLAFVLVLGVTLVHALFATPVYRAHVLLQLEGTKPAGGLLGELEAIENASNTAAELEIMRSHRVALGAARRLEPGALLVEENAHRPFETTLRRFLPERAPCAVSVETTPLEEGAPTEHWSFALRRDATGLRLTAGLDGTRHEVRGIVPGEPVEVLGRDFTFRVDGDPDGRRWLLTLRAPGAMARWIREQVRAEEVGRMTGMVELGVAAGTPAVARVVAQAVADSYLSLKREHKREQTESALQFLGDETARVKKRLGESEDALDRARTELDAVLLSDRASWIVEKSSSLDLQRAQQRVRLAEYRRTRDRLDDGTPAADLLVVLGPEGVDPLTQELTAQVAALELSHDGMVERGMRAAHPERQRVEAELAAANRRLRGGIRAALDARIGQGEALLRHLESKLAEYEAEARTLPRTERVLAQLGRDAEANLQIYRFLTEKEQEAQVALASTLAEVRVIDDAIAPDGRARPLLVFHGLLGFVLACAAAVFVALVAEALDRSIKSPHELEREAGVPMFAAIPDFRTVRKGVGGRYRGEMIVRDRPASALAEAYRTLRSNLRFAALDRSVKSVTITSAGMGEGKTITICNLALACAQQGERTILIDMDLRRPDTHRHFGNPVAPGLADWLAGGTAWEDVVRPSGVDGLDVVHAGGKVDNPSAALDSDRIGQLLERLHAEYDRVLVDLPPVLAVSDAAAVLSRLDGVLLVARARRCHAGTLEAARDQLRRVGANLLGVVFNAFDARQAQTAGYGSYGYYGYGGYEARADDRAPRGGNGASGTGSRDGGRTPRRPTGVGGGTRA